MEPREKAKPKPVTKAEVVMPRIWAVEMRTLDIL
jgi:hypothetical protein